MYINVYKIFLSNYIQEANVLNNRDGDVWAYIALLCLTLNRLFEANQSISQALRFGLKDHEILK